jgi:phosphohistidine phosphatase
LGARRLTLLRHGHAQSADGCPEDFERVLTHRGQSEAQMMATRIAQGSPLPDLILVSPALRTRATAERVAAACELDPKHVRSARELYLAAPETVWRLVQELDEAVAHVLICGHNPSLSQIASRLGPAPQPRELPTAGLATAAWSGAAWADLMPETAASCELDQPDAPRPGRGVRAQRQV